MKKTIIAIVFLMFGLASFGQYTEDKLPSGLTVATTANDADYTIIQKNAESIVKAIRMDSLRSYMTQGMAENIEVLDSVSGQTGQFIISDGVGWLTPISAKFEGDDAYTFGQRQGIVGSRSVVIGGATGFRNTASGETSMAWGIANLASGNGSTAWGFVSTSSGSGSTAWGYGSTASGHYSTAFGNGSTASGIDAVAFSGGDAIGNGSTAWSNGTASGGLSTAWTGGDASGDYSTAWNSGNASGYGATAWSNGDAIGDNSTAWNGSSTASGVNSTAWNRGTASGNNSTAWNGGVASGVLSTAWSNGVASGNNSTAWNSGTAQSYFETSFGHYVDTATTKTANLWVTTDRLLTIGNGTLGSPSNALIMLKNGNTTANGDWTIDGDLEVTGNINTPAGARVGAYVPEDSTLSQVIAADVFEFMGEGGTNKFVNIYANQFSFDGDTLTYNGTDSIYVHIEWGGTVSSDAVNTDVYVTIYVNDVEQPQLKTSSRTATAGELYPLAGVSNIALLPPDATIKIYVMANKDCTLTFPCFSTSLHKIQ